MAWKPYWPLKRLIKKGFVVMPYVHADPVLCKRLEEVGLSVCDAAWVRPLVPIWGWQVDRSWKSSLSKALSL